MPIRNGTANEKNEGIIVSMAVIHIPEAEAARDFAGLLARVRSGDEIVIEKEALPAIVLRVAEEPRGRKLSESIALATEHARTTGFEPRMDPDFAGDLEEIIRNRRPRDLSAWG
jgi:antitoxin (DNA-binding transcriptional repressor) of toxin-antitoxin stability system